ncbi:glucose-6-phosphate dehydrogenase [Streptomyces filamentosus]|uniref:Glucose-6-phosphate 1-dehydrogenase n=2 Tax=Streptomyces filamentosus TaxID=67294 RepID=A0ABY4UNP5_STRFL|nr:MULTISPECIES: glucose-6-phosphate dehydrogenase [Streptomyces]MYR83338.1 glucose-6-phosphate dehydrogenase [Streptomyces sp. SID5466]USC45242.1 glucose-6-phosphate dehydrogenase [Streptomyces filamentosus]
MTETLLSPPEMERSDALVLFGISGDLAKKMLLPALYRLTESGKLTVPVIGVAATDWDDDSLRRHAREAVAAEGTDIDEEVFARFAANLSIVTGDFADAATFTRLREAVARRGFVTYYLAIPPSLFTEVAGSLAAEGLNRNARLVVEKPFGHDVDSARKLQDELSAHFDNAHLLRVDHFLGNRAVESLMVSRFANTLLAPIWHRAYVDNVQITLAEDFDVADRGSFYDAVGCLRDVVQNHMLQVLALLVMEPPSATNAQAQGLEKWRALHATRTMDPAVTVRGQYDGYRDVKGVKPGSTTETYFATRMFVDNWRWADVPFYLRSGKALAVSATEVVVELRKPPLELFGGDDIQTPPNTIRFRIDGDTGIRADLMLNKPDSTTGPMTVPIGVDFAQVLGRQELPYENILHGAVVGDPECFAFFPAVLECWRIVGPVLDPAEPPLPYAPGSWGPEAGDRLPGLRNWHELGSRLFGDARPAGERGPGGEPAD